MTSMAEGQFFAGVCSGGNEGNEDGAGVLSLITISVYFFLSGLQENYCIFFIAIQQPVVPIILLLYNIRFLCSILHSLTSLKLTSCIFIVDGGLYSLCPKVTVHNFITITLYQSGTV